MTFITKTPEETELIGRRLATYLDGQGISRAFVAIYGEMGVGKTAFTRGFASALDISGVRSPTYTVVNEYRGRRRVYHFDMYRIETEDDLISIGFDDYVFSDGYSIAEWCENIKEDIPEDAISVTISRTPSPDERKITVDFNSSDIAI